MFKVESLIIFVSAIKNNDLKQITMKQTNKEIKMNFRGYDIVIPAGTRTTHKTALGIDPNYNFIDDFSFIPKDMPLLKHDAMYYGIDIPAEDVSDIK